MHCQFNPGIQWDCLKSVVSIIREGDLNTQKTAEVAEHVACFVGCASAMFRKEDPKPEPTPAPDKIDVDVTYGQQSTMQLADELEKHIPSEDQYGAIDWSMLWTTILPLLVKLLESLFTEKPEK